MEKDTVQTINLEGSLDIGDRVIVRSNEDDPLMIGEYIGDQEVGKGHNRIPLVRSESDGKIYLILGLIKRYSEKFLQELEKMSPKEQWNYLSKYYKRS